MSPLLLRLLIGSAIGIVGTGLIWGRGKKDAKHVDEMVHHKRRDQRANDSGVEPNGNEFRTRVKQNAKRKHNHQGRGPGTGGNPVSELRSPARGADSRKSDVEEETDNAIDEQDNLASGNHGGGDGGSSSASVNEPADSESDEE